MGNEETFMPDSTAARVALWRALHVQSDPPPHVLEDEIGLKLLAPDEGWKNRPGYGSAGHTAVSRACRRFCSYAATTILTTIRIHAI